jgi:hypothetical protein
MPFSPLQLLKNDIEQWDTDQEGDENEDEEKVFDGNAQVSFIKECARAVDSHVLVLKVFNSFFATAIFKE